MGVRSSMGGGHPPSLAGVRHDVIYLILGLQSVSSRLSTVSVDTSRSDQPPPVAGGRHSADRPEHHHEHRHNHRHHHHEHHHSVSPRPNQRHPATTSTTVTTNTTDATSPQSNAQRRPVPRYVRICESMDYVDPALTPPYLTAPRREHRQFPYY